MLQLMRTTPVRLRILISTVIGVASAVFCWFLLRRLHQGAADFTWAIRAAHHLLAGKNPYDTPLEQYPLTAALFGLPLVLLRPEVAAALFYGISSALATALDSSTRLLRALHSPSGLTRSSPDTRALALSRPRCMVTALGCHHASALVFRRIHSLAHPENSARDFVYGVLQLGSRHLALVPVPAQL